MQYTPGQLRDAVGLSKEAFRHWKRVLPAFPDGKSHGPSFSPGDVLACAVLHRLTQSCGVRIGQLKGVSTRIFAVCNETPWDMLADCVLVVDLANQECATVPKTDQFSRNNAVVVCPMAPVIAVLREHLLPPSSLAARRSEPESSERAAAAGSRQ